MCNLKSNKTLEEILNYKKNLKNVDLNNKELVLFPSLVYLPFFYSEKYKIGSQNISKYNTGSHTGEVLAYQLASLKVNYVLINHCEMEENEESIIKKIKNAYQYRIKVVLCFGKKTSSNKDIAIEELKIEIKNIFSSLTIEEIDNIIVAFEPFWTVNTTTTIDLSDLTEIAKNIKQFIKNEYNCHLPFIYGGGITQENFQNILKLDIIDGFLIGNSAINPENVIKMAEFV
jgi:triosephosphate isomerase